MQISGVYVISNNASILVHIRDDDNEKLDYKYVKENWKEAEIKYEENGDQYFMIENLKMSLSDFMRV